VFRPLSADISPAEYTYQPYFAGIYDKEVYCGVTNYWGAKQYNSFCSVHFDYEAYKNGELEDYEGVHPFDDKPVNISALPIDLTDTKKRLCQAVGFNVL